jgi:hypothetical protein
MGFMDLSIGGSDVAAGSASVCVSAFAKQLAIEFKEKGSEYNTPGPLNTAMIIVEMCDDMPFILDDEMQKVAAKCLKWFEDNPDYCQGLSHDLRKAFKKIRKGIETFIADGKF